MICHRTIGPDYLVPKNAVTPSHTASVRACLGSACALWVPEYGVEEQRGPRIPGSYGAQEAPGGKCYPYTEPTGRGWCADNLRREPIQDPAKKENA